MKEDWLPDWVVPEIAILGDDSNIPIGVRQVKSTITLISSSISEVDGADEVTSCTRYHGYCWVDRLDYHCRRRELEEEKLK